MRYLTAREVAQMREMVEAIWGISIDDLTIITARSDRKILEMPFTILPFVIWKCNDDALELESRTKLGKLVIPVDRWINGERSVRVGYDPEHKILAMAIQ